MRDCQRAGVIRFGVPCLCRQAEVHYETVRLAPPCRTMIKMAASAAAKIAANSHGTVRDPGAGPVRFITRQGRCWLKRIVHTDQCLCEDLDCL